MRKKDVVKLISVTYTENSIGDTIEVPVKREVLAGKKSIRQSEFYQAQANGLRPELTFVIWLSEYQDESQLEYKGVVYNIIRTFEPNEKDVELICQGVVNNAST